MRIWNYKGVINREEKFMKMIKLAKKYKKVVNGHVPGLTGKLLKAYISARIDDDYERECPLNYVKY
nr:hypothetical protein [Thermodesulfobacteriota bacterium]